MNNQIWRTAGLLILLIPSLHAAPDSRQATLTGGGGRDGRCSVEVTVDGAAEVSMFADRAELTTLSGQPAVWRRFECTSPMPRAAGDYRLGRANGRGSIRLLEDLGHNRGRMVVRIEDPQGGRGHYIFDVHWYGGGGPGWMPGPPLPPQGPPMGRAIQACQDSVTTQLNRNGYPYVSFISTAPENNPGRQVWLTGSVTGSRRFGSAVFSFSCSVDVSSGRVRSVDVRPQHR